VLGDPKFISWLIEQMGKPGWGLLAGEVCTMITGADLDAQGFARDAPEGASSGPTDDDADDINVAMDLNDDLPWPDSRKIEAWWPPTRRAFPATLGFSWAT